MLRRRIAVLTAVMLLVLTGCRKVKFVRPFSDSEFACVNDRYFSTAMAELLLNRQKNAYEEFFDRYVWEQNIGNMTMEEYVTDSVKNMVKSIMYLNSVAEEMGINLTEDESVKISEAVEECGIEERKYREAAEELFRLLMLSEKAFYAITDDVDTEVSTDDARTISVQYIFMSTMEKNEDGSVSEVGRQEKEIIRKRAEKLLLDITEGTDFASAASEESDDSVYVLEFGKGKYNRQFEDAAFALEMGEVSGVVETGYGYYIIKCINDNITGDNSAGKAEIVLQRRKESFETYYLENAGGMSIRYNEKYLAGLELKELNITSGNLFEIYKNIFVSTQQ